MRKKAVFWRHFQDVENGKQEILLEIKSIVIFFKLDSILFTRFGFAPILMNGCPRLVVKQKKQKCRRRGM